MRARRRSVVLASVAGALASVGMAGWVFGAPWMLRLHPDWAYMHWLTAVGLVVAAGAVVLRAVDRSTAARVLGGVALLLGVVKIVLYVAGVDLPTPSVLALPETARSATGPKMAPNTALCFMAVGLAEVLRSGGAATPLRSPRVGAVAGISLAVATALGFVGAASYATGLPGSAAWQQLTTDMALHTAMGFVAIGWAGLAELRERDPHFERWAPRAVTVGGMAVAFTLWQMVGAAEQQLLARAPGVGRGTGTPAATVVLLTGVLAAIFAGRFHAAHLTVRRQAGALARANAKLARNASALGDANAALERRTQELERVNQDLEAFAETVSHDLRAPARAVEGFTRILEEDHGDVLDDEGRRVLGVIASSTRRMGAQIEGLLTFSRMGRSGLDRRLVDMEDLVRRAYAEALGAHLQRHLDAPSVQLDVAPLPEVRVDPGLVDHVWTNLLVNALEYSRRTAQPHLHVTHAADEAKDVHRFEVRDNGVGFDPALADRLFRPFSRLHGRDAHEGVGIGLSVVERIVRAHGGEVWASSSGVPGEGARFGFSLPRT